MQTLDVLQELQTILRRNMFDKEIPFDLWKYSSNAGKWEGQFFF